jgi:3-hydroxybutyryl-CoA dehydratase
LIKVYEYSKFISSDMVENFAESTGDYNPIHLNESFARTAGFNRPICHGALVASFISPALTHHFGQNTIYVRQDLKFIKPIYVNSDIVIKFSDLVLNKKGRIELKTDVYVLLPYSEPVLSIVGKAEIISGIKAQSLIQ